MKKTIALVAFLALGCQSKPVASTDGPTVPTMTPPTSQSAEVSEGAKPGTESRKPANEVLLQRLECWKDARRMDDRQAVIACLDPANDPIYNCWKGARGVPDPYALPLCAYSGNLKAEAIQCWKGAKGINSEAAVTLCLNANSEAAIQCYRETYGRFSGLDSDSAALLCSSPNATDDIQCWKSAKGVRNRPAAELCYSGSRDTSIYKGWKYLQQASDERSAYSSGRSSVTCPSCN